MIGTSWSAMFRLDFFFYRMGASTWLIFGSQDCSQFKNGAYTGDISAEMIKKIGCKYVLIGHSERRLFYNETNEVLRNKINRALEQNLKIIFCVGEKIYVFCSILW